MGAFQFLVLHSKLPLITSFISDSYLFLQKMSCCGGNCGFDCGGQKMSVVWVALWRILRLWFLLQVLQRLWPIH
ncbi:unnamed protein product [Coffea canephora]|uniref:Uncharacterized protein n=1 Tax=Coffea canephora TaxID=49390 RepID=A0A068V6P2_COFCA|nr:unnamed protein product [Coffea canephora]